MLGKGLESLIPPQKSKLSTGQAPHQSSDEHGTGQAPQQGNGGGQIPSDSPIDSVVSAPQGEVVGMPPIIPKNSQLAGEDFRSKMSVSPPGEKKEKTARTKSEEDYIFHIEVSKIKANPTQPRRDFNEAGIKELAYSVREFGFLQPLVVSKIEKETPTGVEVEYQLIAGERRLLAAKMLGLEAVPAIIRRVDLEREKLELAVIENIQRENLNPIETARAFARLQDEFRMTQREIAAKLGKSREVVANSVRLLSLPTYAQEALERGQITESHGRFLLAIGDPAAQKKLFDDILAQHLTMRGLKERVQAEKFRARTPKEELSPELKMMEERLSSELGTPVKIEKGVNTGGSTGLTAGKITITFYSEEELESIVRKIGKEEG